MTSQAFGQLDRRGVLTGALGLLALGAVPALPALTGCSGSSSGSGPAAPQVPGLQAIGADLQRRQVKVGDVANLAAVVAGMTAFGAHLHRVAATSEANFTASPLSIAVALGMLRAGSRGRTASQLDVMLGLPAGGPADGVQHVALNALTAQLVTVGPGSATPAPLPSGQYGPDPIVALANGLFIEAGFAKAVAAPFLKVLATDYGAHAQSVNFADGSASATLNAWVAQQTRGRIKKLFDSLDPGTLLVLANAVYFKAAWISQFLPSSTRSGPFATGAGGSVAAQLMRQTVNGVRYAEHPQWQRVTLPYVGSELSMRVVLPRVVARDTATLSSMLDAATAATQADQLGWVDLTLPRWKAETDLPLLAPLGQLGWTDLGDLAGIATGLGVTDAIHRATITVDELGSEAAAVTGIAIAASARGGTPPSMRVDRPFVWAIVHEPTGTPVFVGHVVNPS